MTSETGDGTDETGGKASGEGTGAPKDNLLADDPEEEGGKVNLFTDDAGDDLPGDGPLNLTAEDAPGAEDETGAGDGKALASDDPGPGSASDDEGSDDGADPVSGGDAAADEAEAEQDLAASDGDVTTGAGESDGDEILSADQGEETGDETPAPVDVPAAETEGAEDENQAVAASDGQNLDVPPAGVDAIESDVGPVAAGDEDAPSEEAEPGVKSSEPGVEPDGDAPAATADSDRSGTAGDEDVALPADVEDEDGDDAASDELVAEGLSGDSFWDKAPEDAPAGAGDKGTDGEDATDAGAEDSPVEAETVNAQEAEDEPEAPAAETEPEPVLVTRSSDPDVRGLGEPAPPVHASSPNPILAAGLAGGGVQADDPEEEDGDGEDDAYLDETEEEEELHQSTFLRKLGVGAGLLVAGALAGLWVGPKIAPDLPAGLGPVRDFLMPGQSQAQAEIAALRGDLDRAIATLPRPRTESQIAAIVAGSVAANRTEYEDRIAALEAQVKELSELGARPDATGFEPRIAALENRVGGLAAQLASLNESLTTFESDGSISDEAMAQMAGFTANVEAVRAEVSGLVEQIATLEEDITEVRASSERRVETAENEIAAAQEQARRAEAEAETSAALALIDAALESGQPFPGAVARLEPFADVPPDLAAVADGGVATLPALRNGFAEAAHGAIRASIQAEAEDSVLGRMEAFVNAQVANRSLTPQEGMTTDAILSRAEDALRQPDLAAAAAEIASLSDAARAAMGDWAVRLQERVKAEAALARLHETLNTAREG